MTATPDRERHARTSRWPSRAVDVARMVWWDVRRSPFVLAVPVAFTALFGALLLALDRGLDAYIEAKTQEFEDLRVIRVTRPPPEATTGGLVVWDATQLDALQMMFPGVQVIPRATELADIRCRRESGDIPVQVEALEAEGGRRRLEKIALLPGWSGEYALEVILSEKLLREHPECDQPFLVVRQRDAEGELPLRVVARSNATGKADVFVPLGVVLALSAAEEEDMPAPASWVADGQLQPVVRRVAQQRSRYERIDVHAPDEKTVESIEKTLEADKYTLTSPGPAVRKAARMRDSGSVALGFLLLFAAVQAVVLLSWAFRFLYEARAQEFLELRLLGIGRFWAIANCALQAGAVGLVGSSSGLALAAALSLSIRKVWTLEDRPLLVSGWGDAWLLLPGAIFPLLAAAVTIRRIYSANPAEVLNEDRV